MRALVAFQLTPPLGSSIAGSAAYEEPLIRQSCWPVLAALQLSPVADGHWELRLHLPMSLRYSNERRRNGIAAVVEFAAGSRYAAICNLSGYLHSTLLCYFGKYYTSARISYQGFGIST